MSDIYPPPLVAYLEQSLATSSLTLITSVLNATANWLITRYLYASLKGVDPVNVVKQQSSGNESKSYHVIFLSLIRPLDIWIEFGKKLGLDILSLLKAKQLTYINGLAQFGPSGIGIDGSTIRLKSIRLSDIQIAVSTAIRAHNSTATGKESTSLEKPIIIIDGLDFVLASQTDVDSVQVQQFLSSLRLQCHAIIMTASADSPLIHNRDDSATPLESEHAAFLTTIAHQSDRIMQVRGLETGTAKDITGVLRVSRGGATGGEDETPEELANAEWLYHVRGDGQIKLWTRGE